jgi:chitodextrinase
MKARGKAMSRLNRIAIVMVVACLTFGLALPEVRAVVVDSAPVWPIPVDAPPAPPPIPSLPATGPAQPPAELISDPVTPTATCGGWALQTSYGGRWPATSTWWEYTCTYQVSEYHNTCPGPACDAFCPSCYWHTRTWVDYFYWNGSDGVFYGEGYSESVVYDSGLEYVSAAWWDGPTGQWYALQQPTQVYALYVDLTGDGIGSVTSSPGGIQCPDVCTASFESGTVITLTATADATSIFSGWSGDCSGSGACQVTMDGEHYVRATFAKPHVNVPPSASITATCRDLECALDGRGSTDADGSIATYAWDFGDGSTASGAIVWHTYGQAPSYTVTLTVIDDVGAAATTSKVVSPISGLTARAYKYRGANLVDLSWSGASGTSVDVLRNGWTVATVSTTTYSDTVAKGPGRYTYRVCDAARTMCSNEVTVGF